MRSCIIEQLPLRFINLHISFVNAFSERQRMPDGCDKQDTTHYSLISVHQHTEMSSKDKQTKQLKRHKTEQHRSCRSWEYVLLKINIMESLLLFWIWAFVVITWQEGGSLSCVPMYITSQKLNFGFLWFVSFCFSFKSPVCVLDVDTGLLYALWVYQCRSYHAYTLYPFNFN